MNAKKLMEYYYNSILYRPEYPEKNRKDYLVSEDKTYVPYESIFGGESQGGYEIYIGQVSVEEILKDLDRAEGNPSSDAFLCMIRTDKRGYYVKQSFYLSPVLFALAKILKENNPMADLDLSLINRANDEFDEFLVSFDRKLEFRELNEVFNYVVNKLNLSEFLPEFSARIKERDPLAFHANDGYLKDLEDMILSRGGLGDVETIAEGIHRVMKASSPLKDDYSLLRVKEITSPEKNPLSLWPGQDRLGLRDQLILNQLASQDKSVYYPMVHKDEAIIKLLPEIIGQSILDRAVAMIRYANPDEAFKEVNFKQNKELSSSYYLPEDRLVRHNLVLADDSVDLVNAMEEVMEPALTALDPYPYYHRNGKPYLTEKFSSNLDILRFLRYFVKKDDSTLNQIKGDTPNWEEARKRFRLKLEEAARLREEILGDYRLTFGYPDMLEKVSAASLKEEELKGRVEAALASKALREKELKDLEAAYEEKDAHYQELKAKIGFLKNLFSFFFAQDEDLKKKKLMQAELAEMEEAMTQANQDMNMAHSAYHDLKEEGDAAKADYEGQKAQVDQAAIRINSLKDKYEAGFADEEKLAALVKEGLRSESQLWIHPQFNQIRQELTMEAWRVHKAFISSSRFLKTNLALLALFLEGKIQEEDPAEVHRELIKTLGMVAPLLFVSTDYAPYFFSTFETGQLPTVVIPRGKALPLEENLGLLWRSRKTIVFAGGRDHWYTPRTPAMIQDNLIHRIGGGKPKLDLDLSIADAFNQ